MEFEDVNQALGYGDLCVSEQIFKEWLEKNRTMFICNSQINWYWSKGDDDLLYWDPTG